MWYMGVPLGPVLSLKIIYHAWLDSPFLLEFGIDSTGRDMYDGTIMESNQG